MVQDADRIGQVEAAPKRQRPQIRLHDMDVGVIAGVGEGDVNRVTQIDTDDGFGAELRHCPEVSSLAAAGVEHRLALDVLGDERRQPLKQLPSIAHVVDLPPDLPAGAEIPRRVLHVMGEIFRDESRYAPDDGGDAAAARAGEIPIEDLVTIGFTGR